MFTNREIASSFWLLVLAIWALSQSAIRKSVGELLLAFFKPIILICIGAMLAYTVCAVAILLSIGVWNSGMVKDAAIWLCFSGFVMVMEFATSKENGPVLKKIFFDNIKVLIIIEFIINTYTMPLIAELVFVPFITLLVVMDAFAQSDTKYASIARLTSCIIPVLGFLIFGFAIWCVVGNLKNLDTMETFRSIAFPPLMSLLFAPFVYLLVLWDTYNNVFIRLTIGPKKTLAVIQYAKRRILLRHGLNLNSLRDFSKRFPQELFRIKTREDVDKILDSLERGWPR